VAGRGSFPHLGADGAAQRPPMGGWRPGEPESDQTIPLPDSQPAAQPIEDTVQLPLASLSQALPAIPPAVPPPPPPAPRARRPRALLAVLASVVVLLLALAAVVVVRPGPVDKWLGGGRDDSVLGPLPSDPPPEPVLAGAATDAPMPSADGVKSAIAPLVTGSRLGSRFHISVVDMATGERLYGRGQDVPTLPASTNKLITAATVLATRGPDYRIPTRAVAGDSPGEVVLVGGGDPTLAVNANGSYPGAARLDQLAGLVKQALGGTAPTKVIVDSSLFTGPVYGPWDSDIAHNGYAGPAVALMTDGARVNPEKVKPPAVRHKQPDLAAGRAFAKALGLPASAVSRGTAPADGQQLGQVESMPISRMVEIMLSESDNVIAEMLARQVALAKGQPASYAGAAAAMKTVLTDDLGLPAGEIQLSDGSGFSRADKLSPSVLTDLLRISADSEHPELRAIFSGLPVAGWSGTLQDRYRTAAAGSRAGAGVVRAKTGTLRGVNAIAGVVVDADGRPLAFALMADAVSIGEDAAEDALDRIAAKLATCGCR